MGFLNNLPGLKLIVFVIGMKEQTITTTTTITKSSKELALA
jgi:hypothetical protein